MRNVTFANSINDALEIAMTIDNKIICYGLVQLTQKEFSAQH